MPHTLDRDSAVDPPPPTLLLAQGHYRQALAAAERAARAAQDRQPPEPLAAADALLDLAQARRELAQFAAAEAACLEALPLVTAAAGKDHPAYARGLRELARAYEGLGRYQQAATLDQQALAVRQRLGGEPNLAAAQSLVDLAGLTDVLGRNQEADRLAAQAEALHRAAGEPAGAEWGHCLFARAWAQSGLGKLGDALALADRGCRALQAAFPAGHPEVAWADVRRARLLLAAGRAEEGRPLLEQALQHLQAGLGADHPRALTAARFLARRDDGQADKAEEQIRAVLDQARRALGETHPLVADCLADLAQAVAQQDRGEEAVTLARQAWELERQALGERHPNALAAQAMLARFLAERDRPEEAEALAREAVAHFPPEEAAVDLRLGSLHLLLARVLARQERWAEARDAARQAATQLEAQADPQVQGISDALWALAHLEQEAGDKAEAAKVGKRAYDLAVAAAGKHGPPGRGAARAWAHLRRKQDDFTGAEALLREVLAATTRQAPPCPLEQAAVREELAAVLAAQGKGEEAEELLQAAIQARRRHQGDDHPALAASLLGLGGLYEAGGDLAAAEVRYREALDLHRRRTGPESLPYAHALHQFAGLRARAGLAEAALRDYQEALAIYGATQGEASPAYALCQVDLGSLLRALGKRDDAEPLLTQALRTLRKARGPRHSDTVHALHALALLHLERHAYRPAEKLLRQVIATLRQHRGPRFPGLLGPLMDLIRLHLALGDHVAAEGLARERLELRQHLLGADHPNLAPDHLDLAILYRQMGEGAAAGREARRCQDLLGRLRPPHPDAALPLLTLAGIALDQDQAAEAQGYVQEALRLRREALGAQHPLVATALQQLATVRLNQDDLAGAARHLAEATALLKAALGADHLDYANSLRQEAQLRQLQQQWPEAVALWRRCLAILQKHAGDTSPALLPTLAALSTAQEEAGQLADAEETARQAVDLARRALPEEDPAHALHRFRLAEVLFTAGRTEPALAHQRQALAHQRQALGPDHPRTAQAAQALGWWLAAAGQAAAARDLLRPTAVDGAAEAQRLLTLPQAPERFSCLNELTQRDRQRLALLAAPPPAEPAAVAEAYEAWLRHRAGSLAALTTLPLEVRLGRGKVPGPDLQRLLRLRRQAAHKHFQGPGKEGQEHHRALLAQWTAEADQLEAGLPPGTVAGPDPRLAVTVADLARALPPGAALVEYLVAGTGAGLRLGADPRPATLRYLAVVLRGGDAASLRLIDLGEREALEAQARAWYAALSAPRGTGEAEAGTAVRDALLAPVQAALGDAERLVVVAEGPLSLLPLDALPTPDGGRLIDRVTVSTLTDATDLVAGTPAAVGGPARVWTEAAAVQGWWRTLLGLPSAEARLARALGTTPQPVGRGWEQRIPAGVAHLGFATRLQVPPPPRPTAGGERPAARRWQNPLAECRLRYQAPGPDEVTALMLAGRRLGGAVVVQPALGAADADAWEAGRTWLLRAWSRAGAGAVIANLWPLAAADRAALCEAFYTALVAGRDPAAALREAKRAHRAKRGNPLAWAGLNCQGGIRGGP